MSNSMKSAMQKAGINVQGQAKATKAQKKKISKTSPGLNVSKPLKGKIKWFDIKKGIGFITCEDGSEHFVYRNQIALGRTYIGLEAGDEVTFRVTMDTKTNKSKAVQVMMVIDEADESADEQAIDDQDDLVEDSEDQDEE